MANSGVTGGSSEEIPASTSYVRLLGPRGTRRLFLIFNNSTSALYIRFGEDYSTWSVRIPAMFYYEAPQPVFCGGLTGKWDMANGEAHITEFF